MALFPASDFTGYTSTFALPSGVSGVLSAGSVDLILSTGITQQVFGTKYCFKMYSLHGSK